jgi:hypothetical protein
MTRVEQGLGNVWNTRQSLSWATKGLGETTPAIDLHQEVFNADERKRTLKRYGNDSQEIWPLRDDT